MILGGVFLAEYVTSDWHFGHSYVVNTERKEFIGKENIMNETIVGNINKVLTLLVEEVTYLKRFA